MAGESDVCAVCLDEFDPAIAHVACCKHAFHEACVQKLARCPLCRMSWKEDDEDDGFALFEEQ